MFVSTPPSVLLPPSSALAPMNKSLCRRPVAKYSTHSGRRIALDERLASAYNGLGGIRRSSLSSARQLRPCADAGQNGTISTANADTLGVGGQPEFVVVMEVPSPLQGKCCLKLAIDHLERTGSSSCGFCPSQPEPTPTSVLSCRAHIPWLQACSMLLVFSATH